MNKRHYGDERHMVTLECVYYPSSDTKTTKKSLKQDVAVQKNSMSSNSNPSVKVTPQTTHSPHILYTYVFR